MGGPRERETVGTVTCKFCEGADCEVRKDKNGFLYYYCHHGCQTVHNRSRGFQHWIAGAATIHDPDTRQKINDERAERERRQPDEPKRAPDDETPDDPDADEGEGGSGWSILDLE